MSCYICERETFLKIIKGMKKFNIIVHEDENEMFSNLVYLNWDSVNTRYNENNEPSEYDLHMTDIEKRKTSNFFSNAEDDFEILNAVNEYQYQSCEVDDYHERPAYYKCDWLKDALIKKYLTKETSRI